MSRKSSKIDKSLFDFSHDIKCANDITIKHLEKVYRIDSDVCKSKINKNCVNNVRCLNGLGERSWLAKGDDPSLDDNNNDNFGLRVSGSFVGLKNLGATCYVNCYLQVWFHNPILRKAIYEWRPKDYPEEGSEPNASDSSTDSFPIGCIGKLQLILGLMQFGVRGSVDPTPIIKYLGLDENRQQDAHEFSKLFFNFIENELNSQIKDKIHKTIQSQYTGEIAYITRCQKCSDGSDRLSQFNELDLHIKGCKDIFDSLLDYLKVEELVGNNQYHCENCGSKQDAMRSIQLRKLPPILNLQLLRFVFDPQKDSLKKLNSFIKFPDVLDIKPYYSLDVNSFSDKETTYHLSAVLIHRGPSAHSGHYIAHIKDRNTGFWYKFNDEKVERIEGQKLKLDSDDGIEMIESGDSPKKDNIKDMGWHNSNNAYMLVYKNETDDFSNLQNTYSDWNLPQYLIDAIEKDKKEFQESISDQQKQRDLEISECIEHRSHVKQIYEHLIAYPNQPYELISKKWLSEWLSARSSCAVKPIDHKHLLCSHSKLNYKMVPSFKCISSSGAEAIYDRYCGGPRLNSDSLCRTCVAKQVTIMNVSSQIDDDSKFITSQLKFTLSHDEHSYWIGKDSLRNWKQIKIKSLENNYCDESDDSVQEIKEGIESEILIFNEDILCNHSKP